MASPSEHAPTKNVITQKQRRNSSMHMIASLTWILHAYYTHSQDLELLHCIEQLTRHCINAALVSKHSHITSMRLHLGLILSDRYDRTGKLCNISEAIAVLRTCLVMNTDNLTTNDIKIALSQALYKRFHVTVDVADIHSAVDLLDTFLTHGPETSKTQRALAIAHLALMKSHRLVMEKLNLSTDDLPRVEQTLRDVDRMLLTPEGRSVHLLAQANISFLHLIATQDLNHASEGIRACTAILRDHHITPHMRAQARFGLTQLLLLRGRLMANRSDLLDALGNAELAKTEIETFHTSPHMLAYALFDWSRCKVYGADDLQAIPDLESAAEVLRKALDVCPNPHYNRILIVETLLLALGQCSRLGGQVAPLDEILSLRGYDEEYIQTRPFFATHLAEAMILRAHTTSPAASQSLLTRAIGILQGRMDFYKSRPRDGQTWEKTELNTKIIRAALLFDEFGGLPSTISLDYLILLAREAVHYSVAAHGPSVDLLLCRLLLRQALEHSNLGQVTEVDDIIEQVVAIGTTDRICLAHLAAVQALSLTTRATLEGDRTLLARAWTKYEEAVDDPVSRPRDRFTVAVRWAKFAKANNEPSVAFNAYTHAVGLLPYVICLGDDEFGRLEVLRQVNGIASAAATLALSLDRVDSAIEMLEQSRGTHWSEFYKLRSPADRLPSDLRALWDDVTRALAKEGLSATQRREKGNELDHLLQQIRSTSGFDRFLLPPTLVDITRVAQDLGVAFVMAIPGETYSNVVIIGQSDAATHIRLHQLTTSRVKHLVQRMVALQRELGSIFRQKRKVHLASTHSPEYSHSEGITEVLEELWTTLAHPIVKALKLNPKTGPNRRERKRLIWCPVGALTQLPLHAAGVYDKPSCQDTLSNYVISSYTPTMAALDRVRPQRGRQLVTDDRSPSVLALAQSLSTTKNSLPMARVEVEAIKRLLPTHQVIPTPATSLSLGVSSTLEHLPSVQVLHLACHGHQDQNDVLNSGFELEDGRLTLGQLMKVNIPNAQLAYLSACETASTDATRPDESINLAATMMFVGFKSVIATMWAMDDVDGPFIAKRVYGTIFKDGELDLSAVPWALDDAVRELRESGVPASRWATYVHFGV